MRENKIEEGFIENDEIKEDNKAFFFKNMFFYLKKSTLIKQINKF
jgi:hypothetical protein